jgi:NTE family protein
MRTALVLSGGGLSGAWQAGAWSVLSERMPFDLIVGVSVGSLNGYLMASGITPEELRQRWLTPDLARFTRLPANIRRMMETYHLKTSFAITVTDLLTLKPRVFRDAEITWRHLAASCAIPLVLPQRRLDGRWCSDGGLADPVPILPAVELGATRILALDALPGIRARALRPLIRTFRRVAGYHPVVPPSVEVKTIVPGSEFGGIRDALVWKKSNIEAWWEMGVWDALRALA